MPRTVFLALIATLLAGCIRQESHSIDHGKPHGDEHSLHAVASLMLQTDPPAVTMGYPATINLMIHDASGGIVNSFEIVHEKKIHLIIVREGLDEFAHIHPGVDATGLISTAFTFPKGGAYRLYADYKPTGGKQTTASAEMKVGGPAPPASALTPDVPGKVTGGGVTAQVSLSSSKADSASTIRFELSADGKPIADLHPYLGAMGHLVVISGEGKEYIHAHPVTRESGGPNNVVMFRVHFTTPGIYKGWGQFLWKDGVRVLPFVVNVD